MQSHEGDKNGIRVACDLLCIGGHSDAGGGGTFAFDGADAEPCVAGPALPEEPSDGPGPGGPSFESSLFLVIPFTTCVDAAMSGVL